MRTLLVVMWGIAAASASLAQTKPALTCQTVATQLPALRAEGISELVGDIVLNCTGGAPTPPGNAIPSATFTLFTDNTASFTSNLIPAEGNNRISEALLLIDEPGPSEQRVCGSSAHPYTDLEKAACILVGETPVDQRPNVFRGETLLGDELRFTAVPVDPSGKATTTIRITNVRANVNNLNLQPGENGVLNVNIAIRPDDPAKLTVRFIDTAVPVGNVAYALGFGVQGVQTAPQCEAQNSSFVTSGTPAASNQEFVLRYVEAFPTAFKPRHAGVTPANPNAPAPDQAVPGQALATESGFGKAAASDTWPSADIGRADTGTILTARFNNVLTGVQLWAPRVVQNGTLAARLVTVDLGTTDYVRIPVVTPSDGVEQGQAQVYYEILSGDPASNEELRVPVVFAWLSSGSSLPGLGTTTVNGSFAPLTGTPGTESFPIPRFADYTGGKPSLRGVAAFTIVDCAKRDQVIPRLGVTAGALPVNYFQEGNLPKRFHIYTLTDGAPFSNVKFDTTTPWITILPYGSITPATAAIAVDPTGLAPGSYTGLILVTADGGLQTQVPIPLTVNPPGPDLPPLGVTNTASYLSGVVAAGEVSTIFGKRFGPDSLVQDATRPVDLRRAASAFPTMLGDTRVLFDGVAAPMLYAAPNQVSAIAPFGLEGKTSTLVEVEYKGVKSPGVRLPVVPAVPGLLTANASGSGPAAALNQDNSFNSVIGALPGEYVVLFGVGGPKTDPPGVDGEPYAQPLPKFTGPITVLLDGKEVPAADVAYVGPAPGLVAGVWQANIKLPPNAPRGGTMQVQLRFGTFATQPGVTISVR